MYRVLTWYVAIFAMASVSCKARRNLKKGVVMEREKGEEEKKNLKTNKTFTHPRTNTREREREGGGGGRGGGGGVGER